MNLTEEPVATPDESPDSGAAAATFGLGYQIQGIAGFLKDAEEGKKASRSDYIALKRLDPDAEQLTAAQIAALTHAAHRAKVDCAGWGLDRWRRWAFIAHGIALAGHDAGKDSRFGRQLSLAGVSEPRVTRLLDARGDAFLRTLRRVLRLMDSRNVAPNWVQLANLILNEGAGDPKRRRIAEKTRLNIARDFFWASASESRDE